MQIQPWHWIAFGLVLMIAEMLLPTFFLLWFGASAVVVGVIGYALSLPFAFMVIFWLMLSVAFCVAWFWWIQPLAVNKTKAGLGGVVIIGEVGIIIKTKPDNTGVIRFSVPKVGASEWICRFSAPIALGERAKVVQVVGNELLVAPMNALSG